jgi:hypothetical protein
MAALNQKKMLGILSRLAQAPDRSSVGRMIGQFEKHHRTDEELLQALTSVKIIASKWRYRT